MCATCGCGEAEVRVDGETGEYLHVHEDGTVHAHGAEHGHGADHDHEHEHSMTTGTATTSRTPTPSTSRPRCWPRTTSWPQANRAWLAGRGIAAVNLMSSPGAGKTTLLERTIKEQGGGRPIAVVEGDQETVYDADRIRAAGARAVQINTGSGCHLDATMVRRGLDTLEPDDGDLVVLENVGNLVCPALFDLGETQEGRRHLGHRGRRQAAEVSAHVRGRRPRRRQQDRSAAVRRLRRRPAARRTPAASIPHWNGCRCPSRTGDGMDAWYRWLAAL